MELLRVGRIRDNKPRRLCLLGIDRPAMQRHQEDTGLTFERAPKREGGIG